MKSLLTYLVESYEISEKMINNSVFNNNNKEHKQLREEIENRIKKEGPKCNLNNIDVSNITTMKGLFAELNFDGDISEWDVSNVEDMTAMFQDSTFTGKNTDFSKWDVSNVTDMSYMFAHAKSFNQDISDWDVSKVTNMMGMFEGSNFNGDISGWNVSNVKLMKFMFSRSKFNQDISSWKVGNKPVDMSYMFSDSLFNQNISNWKLKDSCIVNNMFKGCDIKEEYKPFIGDKRVS